MLTNRPLSKTEKCRKVLEESLENVDRLDITDLLMCQEDLINEILVGVEEMQTDPATSNYIFSLVSTCNFMLQTIRSKFLDEEY